MADSTLDITQAFDRPAKLKAQIKLAEYREQVQAEKERQVQIAETRLKNLKKARRAKRRKQ